MCSGWIFLSAGRENPSGFLKDNRFLLTTFVFLYFFSPKALLHTSSVWKPYEVGGQHSPPHLGEQDPETEGTYAAGANLSHRPGAWVSSSQFQTLPAYCVTLPSVEERVMFSFSQNREECDRISVKFISSNTVMVKLD